MALRLKRERLKFYLEFLDKPFSLPCERCESYVSIYGLYIYIILASKSNIFM